MGDDDRFSSSFETERSAIGIYCNMSLGHKKWKKPGPTRTQRLLSFGATEMPIAFRTTWTSSGPVLLEENPSREGYGAAAAATATYFPRHRSRGHFFPKSPENAAGGDFRSAASSSSGNGGGSFATARSGSAISKAFEIQLDPNSDFTTIFVVSNVAEPGWCDRLLEECQRWIRARRACRADVYSSRVKIVKLLTYPDHKNVCKLTTEELERSSSLVIPVFETEVESVAVSEEGDNETSEYAGVGAKGRSGSSRSSRKKSGSSRSSKKKGGSSSSSSRKKKGKKGKKGKKKKSGSKSDKRRKADKKKKKNRKLTKAQKRKKRAKKVAKTTKNVSKLGYAAGKGAAKGAFGSASDEYKKQKARKKEKKETKRTAEKEKKRRRREKRKARRSEESARSRYDGDDGDEEEQGYEKTGGRYDGEGLARNVGGGTKTQSFFYRTHESPEEGGGEAAARKGTEGIEERGTVCRKIRKVPTAGRAVEKMFSTGEEEPRYCSAAREAGRLADRRGKTYCVDPSASGAALNPGAFVAPEDATFVVEEVVEEDGKDGRNVLSMAMIKLGKGTSSAAGAPSEYHPERFGNAKAFFDAFWEESLRLLPKILVEKTDPEELREFLDSRASAGWFDEEEFLARFPSFSATTPSSPSSTEETGAEAEAEAETKTTTRKRPRGDSLNDFVFKILTEEIDYSSMGGNFYGFLSSFYPRSGSEKLALTVTVLVPALVALLKSLVGAAGAEESANDAHENERAAILELRDERKLLDAAGAALSKIYSDGLRSDKEGLSAPSVGELLDLSTRETLDLLGPSWASEFNARREDIRNHRKHVSELEERLAHKIATEEPGYRASLRSALEKTYDFDAFSKFLIEATSAPSAASSKMSSEIGRRMASACAARLVSGHNRSLERSDDADVSRFAKVMGIGGNMGEKGAAIRSSEKNDFADEGYDASSFLLIKPGSREEARLKALQPDSYVGDYPTPADVAAGIEGMENANDDLDDAEEDGEIFDLETNRRLFSYSKYMPDGAYSPWGAGEDYEMDDDLVKYEDLDGGGEESYDSEDLELLRSVEGLPPPPRPIKTTTTTITTTKI